MIKSSVKIHDKFSVVIEVAYDIVFKKKKSAYSTITFLFFPDTLNINERKYPKTKFYNDVRLFLKYDISYKNLDELSSGEQSLFNKIKQSTAALLHNKIEKRKIGYTQQIKMFASAFNNLLNQEVDTLLKKTKPSKDEIPSLVKNTERILQEFRKITVIVLNSSLGKSIKKDVSFADEHMSNATEFQLMQLYTSLNKRNDFKGKLEDVINCINYEQKYKKQHGYDSPKDKSVNPEELLYRRNQLKKYIDRVFFLVQEVRKDGAVFEQTILALAAGLAMIFSTGVAFYFQQSYGNFTMPFFFALVVSYMLKDRIKGLISLIFISKSSSFFYDYKIKITNSVAKKVGIFKENFAFVPRSKLDKKIKNIRMKDLVLDVDFESLGEHIAQYKKKIILYPNKFGSDLSDDNISGLTDITRFNFHRIIQYMDDPKKDYVLVKKGEAFTKFANKVYHINLVQKYFTVDGIVYNRYRIIMNRNGIKRIENIDLN